MEWMLMPLKRYADFSGRSRRQEYWMFALFQLLVIGGMALLIGLVGGFSNGEPGFLGGGLMIVLVIAYLGLFLIPGLAVTVRRFHDQDKSGWFILLNFIPYIGGIIVFIFMCLEGTKGPNRFGEDPLGGGAQDIFG
jgi:uncharacterized membrane protein YhaH (DUF805 family)